LNKRKLANAPKKKAGSRKRRSRRGYVPLAKLTVFQRRSQKRNAAPMRQPGARKRNRKSEPRKKLPEEKPKRNRGDWQSRSQKLSAESKRLVNGSMKRGIRLKLSITNIAKN
jgi:hypothetical protein